MRDLPSGTVTFLFTDVEGSTRLLDELGAERYAEALAQHRRALRETFERHGGVEVDTQGDAFFFAFADAREALAAAEEGQRALSEPSNRLLLAAVRVRMGVHTGEPLVTGEGYVGMDVHRGARIAAAGHGGQVLVSETTVAALQDGDGLRDLGEQRLKDLGAPLRLYQLGGGDFPPLKVLYRSTLPVQPSPLVGRERELDELGTLLGKHRVVTLTGPGGSGKTRLALQAAAESAEDFPDGVYWAPLQTVRDPQLVMPAIAQAVEAQEPVAEHIAERRVLLVLDNVEQVVDGAPDVAELLAATPNTKALCTSREPLRIAGEREYQVAPLALGDAASLFRERAAVSEPEDAVREICRRVDCLPLAVELAAARTKLLPPVELLARLEQALPLLTGGRRDAPERQRTLRATIEWSYELLAPEEQRLFRRFGCFTGGATLEAIEAVCDGEVDDVQALVEKSLVRRSESERFGMLETVHEFAAERLGASPDAELVRERHFRYFVELAESAGLAADVELPQRYDLVLADASNFRVALDWAMTTGRGELAARLAVALESFWVTNSPEEGARRIDAILADAARLPAQLRARTLRAWASCTFYLGRRDVAQRALEASLAIHRDLGDQRGIA